MGPKSNQERRRVVNIVSCGEGPAFTNAPLKRKLPSVKLQKGIHVASCREEAQRRSASYANRKFLEVRFCLDKDSCGTGQILLGDAHKSKTVFEELLMRLAQVEWAQQHSNMHMFDMEGVQVRKLPRSETTGMFEIQCEGLAEKRPSVLIGDSVVLIKENGGDGNSERRVEGHEGRVHEVRDDNVLVNFKPGKVDPSHSYIVEFRMNDGAFHAQLGALKQGSSLLTEDVLLGDSPQQIASGKVAPDAVALIEAMNANPGRLNEKQRECVRAIISAPVNSDALGLLLLHGPPGTGKTTTVVGALRKLLQLPGRRVLVCTPTNESANLVCEKLREEDPSIAAPQVVRVCSLSYDPPTDSIVHKHFRHIHNKVKSGLEEARIVVTTVVGASKVWKLGIEPGYFTHIIIDEAARATETEVAVPLLFAASGKGTHITLAGDHKQLGPVIHSRPAIKFGFGRSMLERLITTRPEYAIQLVDNYRSHPEILHVYNSLTYGGTLVARGAPERINALEDSPTLLVPKKPIMFCHVNGRETREKNLPSWKNEQEAMVVGELVKRLLAKHRDILKPADVVVITPYNQQCKEICRALQKLLGETAREVLVTNVEKFQGREAKVVIMSCVRSRRAEDIDSDVAHDIGFLKQPQRLNVAVSRAIAALFVVGNVALLQTDPHWEQLIKMFAAPEKDRTCIISPLEQEQQEQERRLTECDVARLKTQLLERRAAAAAAGAGAARATPNAGGEAARVDDAIAGTDDPTADRPFARSE